MVCALIWCGVAASSPGQIVEAKEPLIGKPEFKVLEQFRDNFGWPDPEIRKGQSVLYIFAEGPSYKVIAVGPPTTNPKAYAEKLDAWKRQRGLPGSIQYVRQESASVAVYAYSASGFGKSGYSLELPLASLPGEVKLEDVTNCSLVFFRLSSPPIELPPSAFVGTDGLRYWNLSADPVKNDVRISEALAGWIFPFLAIVILLPIVGVVGAFIHAKPIRQRTDIAALERETLFFKSMQPIIVAALILHCLVSAPVIASRSLDPAVALWFGTSQIGEGLVVLIVIALLPSLLYSILLRRIFTLEREAEKTIVASGEPMDDEPSERERPKRDLLIIIPMLIPVAVMIAVYVTPTNSFEWFSNFKIVVPSLISCAYSVFPARGDELTAPSMARDLADLKQKVEEAFLGTKTVAGTSEHRVQILRTKQPEFAIYESENHIQLSEWWVRRSSIEEITFSILHKCWFTVSKPVGDSAFAVLAFLAGAVPYVLFVFQSRLSGVTDLVRYASILLPVTVGILYWRMLWLNTRAAMFNTDARVVQATQNPSAAISALERMAQIEEVRKGRFSFPLIPTCRERIERIRERFAA
jgi:hypothetical protein